jgi:hypothetical protein
VQIATVALIPFVQLWTLPLNAEELNLIAYVVLTLADGCGYEAVQAEANRFPDEHEEKARTLSPTSLIRS